MKALTGRGLVTGFWILLATASCLTAQVRFSVYLAPRPMMAEDGAELRVIKDLHYAVGERTIPMHVKEGRQSIEYPFSGKELVLFRIEDGADGELRVPAVKTTVPTGAKRGVLILVQKEDKLGVIPFWLDSQQERPGTAVVCNMAGRDVGLRIDAGQGLRLAANKRYAFRGKFQSREEFAFHQMEAFLTRKQEGKEDRVIKVLSRTVAIPRDDAVVLLLLPKQGDFLGVTTLSPRGVSDPIREEELEKLFAKPEPEGEG